MTPLPPWDWKHNWYNHLGHALLGILVAGIVCSGWAVAGCAILTCYLVYPVARVPAQGRHASPRREGVHGGAGAGAGSRLGMGASMNGANCWQCQTRIAVWELRQKGML